MKGIWLAAATAVMVTCMLCMVESVYAQPAGVDLDAIIFAEDFDGFEPIPFDPCLAYSQPSGFPVILPEWDPCYTSILPDYDFLDQDSRWFSKGPDYIVVGDGQSLWPADPDPCNHVLCVYQETGIEEGTSSGWYDSYAVVDVESLLEGSGKLGDRLFVSFDVFQTYQWDLCLPRGFEVVVLSDTDTKIAKLSMCPSGSAYNAVYQWLMTESVSTSPDRDIPGAPFDAPAWNHYELYFHFAEHYVSIYVGDETVERHRVDIPDKYTLDNVTGVGFGSLIYYKDRIHHAMYDNISISTNFICPAGDADGDCAVNIIDVAVLARDWLIIGEPIN